MDSTVKARNARTLEATQRAVQGRKEQMSLDDVDGKELTLIVVGWARFRGLKLSPPVIQHLLRAEDIPHRRKTLRDVAKAFDWPEDMVIDLLDGSAKPNEALDYPVTWTLELRRAEVAKPATANLGSEAYFREDAPSLIQRLEALEAENQRLVREAEQDRLERQRLLDEVRLLTAQSAAPRPPARGEPVQPRRVRPSA